MTTEQLNCFAWLVAGRGRATTKTVRHKCLNKGAIHRLKIHETPGVFTGSNAVPNPAPPGAGARGTYLEILARRALAAPCAAVPASNTAQLRKAFNRNPASD